MEQRKRPRKGFLFDEELYTWVQSIYDKVKVPLTTKILVDNGFPKNAVARKLRGIKAICEHLGIPCGYTRQTNIGLSWKTNTSEHLLELGRKHSGTPITRQEFSRLYRVAPLSIVKKFGSWFEFCKLTGIETPYEYSGIDGIIQSIQLVANKYNGGVRPNKALYESIRRSHNLDVMNSRSIVNHFKNGDGWFQACRLAGFEVEQDKSMQSRWLTYFENLLGVQLEREVTFDSCRNPSSGRMLLFDGYLKEHNLLLEFQDRSHFEKISYYSGDSGLSERQAKDLYKRTWAEKNGYKLIQYDYRLGFNPLSIKAELAKVGIKIEEISNLYEFDKL